MLAQMEPLRRLLANAGEGSDGASLFETLYSTWCHSAGAAISLCLMSQVASWLAPRFADCSCLTHLLSTFIQCSSWTSGSKLVRRICLGHAVALC